MEGEGNEGNKGDGGEKEDGKQREVEGGGEMEVKEDGKQRELEWKGRRWRRRIQSGREIEGEEDGGEDGGGGRPVELVVTAQTLQSTLSQFYACVYCIIVSNQQKILFTRNLKKKSGWGIYKLHLA